MDDADRHVISLQNPPEVVAASTAAVHGERGVERYRLEHLWCLNLYQGEGVLRLRGRDYPFHTGCASITPPGSDYRFTFSCRTVKTWVHFAPRGERTISIPVLQDLKSRFNPLRISVAQACIWLNSEPERATARIWDALWMLTAAQPNKAGAAHPAVAAALDFIEQQLENPLGPAGIARKSGISPTHLNRLFRQHVGHAIMDHVRQRRAERAAHLLQHTTLPIGRIGELVGIPDPHLFNKTVRAVLGKAPRQVRIDG